MADIISFSSISNPDPNLIRLREPLFEKLMLIACSHYIKMDKDIIHLKEWSVELNSMFDRLQIPERSTLNEYLRLDRLLTAALIESLNENLK